MTGNENIFLSVGSVILQSPVFPGLEGNCASLSCKNKNTSSHLLSDFYKDRLLIDNRITGDMVSHSVSISDEGWHKCSISDVGEPHLKTVLPSKSALLKCNYPEHCFNCYFRILAVWCYDVGWWYQDLKCSASHQSKVQQPVVCSTLDSVLLSWWR